MVQLIPFLEGTWAVLLSIFVWTFLYKESKLYRFAEYTLAAATVANLVVSAYESIMRTGISGGILAGKYEYILPMILGLMLYTMYSKKYSWIQRYPNAVMTSVATGLAVRGIVGTEIVLQIQPTIQLALSDINNWLVILGVITAVYYFVFTARLSLPKKIDYPLKMIGRVFIMAMMGFYIGNTYQSRIVSFIDRIRYIVIDYVALLFK